MRPRLSCHSLDIERAAELLEQVLPVGGGELPVVLVGWRDRQGRIRRVRADYPNGWRLTFRVTTKGEVTSATGSIKLSGSARA